MARSLEACKDKNGQDSLHYCLVIVRCLRCLPLLYQDQEQALEILTCEYIRGVLRPQHQGEYALSSAYAPSMRQAQEGLYTGRLILPLGAGLPVGTTGVCPGATRAASRKYEGWCKTRHGCSCSMLCYVTRNSKLLCFYRARWTDRSEPYRGCKEGRQHGFGCWYRRGQDWLRRGSTKHSGCKVQTRSPPEVRFAR